jgi:hypothetical protein
MIRFEDSRGSFNATSDLFFAMELSGIGVVEHSTVPFHPYLTALTT